MEPILKWRWTRAPKATGLRSVIENSTERPWYLSVNSATKTDYVFSVNYAKRHKKWYVVMSANTADSFVYSNGASGESFAIPHGKSRKDAPTIRRKPLLFDDDISAKKWAGTTFVSIRDRLVL